MVDEVLLVEPVPLVPEVEPLVLLVEELLLELLEELELSVVLDELSAQLMTCTCLPSTVMVKPAFSLLIILVIWLDIVVSAAW